MGRVTAEDLRVPILTQSEDWALSRSIFDRATRSSSNPHPVRRLGAIISNRIASRLIQFQSSPSPKTGRYSMLVKRQNLRSSNPHPVRRLGAIQRNNALLPRTQRSNPHPVRRLGAISSTILYFSSINFCSNPHPVRRLGAIPKNKLAAPIAHVPILTQSEDWALYRNATGGVSDKGFQSSPSPKTGRYQIDLNLGYKVVFQSSPSPKTGRYE